MTNEELKRRVDELDGLMSRISAIRVSNTALDELHSLANELVQIYDTALAEKEGEK